MNKMKAFVVAVLVCTMFSSCGEKDTESESTSSESVVSTETDTVESEESVSEITEQITEVTSELSKDTELLGYGIKSYIPSDFEEKFTRDGYLFESHLDNGDDVYFVYCGYAFYTDDYPDDFTTSDISDILKGDVSNNVGLEFPTTEDNLSFTVDTEIEETILDCSFLYHTGVMHTKYVDDENDLAFAAYYGIVPIKNYNIEKAPVMWIAYSDTENEETISYMQEVVKGMAENAQFEES